MEFSYIVRGYYKIEMYAEDFKRFLGICTYRGIAFLQLRLQDEMNQERQVCSGLIRCDAYEQILEIAQKTSVEVRIVERHGFPHILNEIKQHCWFFIGAAAALFLLIGLSRRIWDISIDGNCYYGEEKIHRFLETVDIRCGMKSADVACMELAAAIRENFPKITWASAELNGCKLIIHLKENSILEETEEEIQESPYDLVAEKDGVIQQILVRNGIAQVETGQSVKKGDVLISGVVPIKNDAAEVVSYQYTEAEGEVYLLSEYAYYDEVEREWSGEKIIEEKMLPFVQIGDYRFDFLWVGMPSLTDDSSEDRKYLKTSETGDWLHITDTFVIPLAWGLKQMSVYEEVPEYYDDEQLETLANKHFFEFCANLEKKGVQIYQNSVKMDISDVSCVMSGKVTVIEKTGVKKLSVLPEDYSDKTEE